MATKKEKVNHNFDAVNPRVNSQWYRASESNMKPHEMVVPLAKSWISEQASRYDCYLKLAEIVGADMSLRGGTNQSFAKVMNEDEASVNEAANTIETLHSQIYKNRILPSVISVGGDYTQFSRAKKLTRWIDGICDEARLHSEVVPKKGMHALTYGTGIIRTDYDVVASNRAKIRLSTISPMDVYVDPAEQKAGRIRNLLQLSPMDRLTAIEEYVEGDEEGLFGSVEDRRKAIKEARLAKDIDYWHSPYMSECDDILVYEMWHLPTPGGKYGRYCLCTDAGTLIDREYNFQDFQHTFFRCGVSLESFWGDSAVASIAPAQRAFDKMNVRIDACHDIMGIPRILVQTGCKVSKSKIDDVEGSIIEVDGIGNVKEWNPQPINPDAYRHRDSLAQSMRSRLGVSQFSSTGQLPAQLREASGVALENWQDSESSRHAMLHRFYEDGICQLVYRIIDVACMLDDYGYSVQSLSDHGNTLEKIDFAEVRMDRDDFKLKVLPVSHLARTFTGRVNQLGPLLKNQAISLPTYRRLLEVPDIEAENDKDTSDDEIIDMNLSHMLETGEYLPPMPFDNLDQIIKKGTRFFNMARVKKADEDKLDPIAQYIEEARAMLAKANAPMPQPNQPPQGPPPEGAMPAPPEGMPAGPPPAGPPMQ